jgi:hypothetical protein
MGSILYSVAKRNSTKALVTKVIIAAPDAVVGFRWRVAGGATREVVL